MNKQTLDAMFRHLIQVHGIGIRGVEMIPADQLDAHPIPGMRTPKELVVHIYGVVVREISEGVLRGTIQQVDEQAICDRIRTHADLVQFCKESWDAAATAREKITDQHLASMVNTPWNFQAPGYIMFGITHDEYLHHRGQLYAFLRVFGIQPVMIWDFGNNAPEYQPKQPAGA
jgi:uncharacterized damage-inducible protein DinB